MTPEQFKELIDVLQNIGSAIMCCSNRLEDLGYHYRPCACTQNSNLEARLKKLEAEKNRR